jgi:hypothetical protein
LIAVAALATFTMTSKPQAVAFLPVILLAMLWLPHTGLDTTGDRFRLPFGDQVIKGLIRRWPALLACAVLVLVSVQYLGGSAKRPAQMSMYKQVFLEILPHSPHPAADLRALGVDPKMASSNGLDINDPGAASRLPQYLQFRDKVTQTKIAEFYATHPDRLFAVAADGLRAVAHFRQDYLGSYTPDSGHSPGARECRICVYTGMFSAARHQPTLVLGLWLFTLVAGMRVLRDTGFDHTERAVGRLAVVLVGAAVFEFWSVMLSEGRADTLKHMVFTNFLSALCIPVLLLCLVMIWAANARVLPAAPVVAEEPTEDRDPWLDLIVWDDLDDFAQVPETWADVPQERVQAERASGYEIGTGGSERLESP